MHQLISVLGIIIIFSLSSPSRLLALSGQEALTYNASILSALAKAEWAMGQIPWRQELELANTVLLNLAQGVNLLSDKEKDPDILKKLGLKAVTAASGLVAYALQNSFPWLSTMVGSTPLLLTQAPTALAAAQTKLYAPLPEKRVYNLDAFAPAQLQEVYLNCVYDEPGNTAKKITAWPYKKDLSPELQQKLMFVKDTVVFKGRWISDGSSFAFGTMESPLKLEAACIEAITAYAREKNVKLTNPKYVQKLARSSSFGYDYPIQFYLPLLRKAPTWQKMKPVIIKEAVRLMP